MNITFEVNGRDIGIAGDADRTLDLLAIDAGVPLDRRCGGKGVCRRCRVLLGPGRYRVQGVDREVPEGGEVEGFACLTRAVSEGCRVRVPASSLIEEKGQIGIDFRTGSFQFGARTRRLCVEVPAPTQDHPRADRERLLRAIETGAGMKDVRVPLTMMRELPLLLNGVAETVTVTLSRFNHQWYMVRAERGDTTDAPNLAVVTDIGTTTVVCALVDLNTGAVLDKVSRYNQQIRLADDVASRISLAETPAQLEEMRRLVIGESINPLIEQLCARAETEPDFIHRLVVSGNTVMMHLFLAIPPVHIGRIPFQPAAHVHEQYWAAESGVEIHPRGVIDLVPAISGYVGGDLTADIYVSGLHRREQGIAALIDIGTNGEIVLAENGSLWAAATAAGPAFEGAGLRHGSRAAEGAIEHIRLDGEGNISLSTIGDVPPAGICGSAIIDFIAELNRRGWLTPAGRYVREKLEAAGRAVEIEEGGHKLLACVLADAESSASGEPIVVTEGDVAEVLKAKAAIYAGMQTLLRARGLGFEDLEQLILAGGFAQYVDLRNAMEIGLLPRLPEERVESIGNGSLAGAYLAAVDEDACRTYQTIVHRPRIIPLNLQPDFEDDFIDALSLPEGDAVC
ncbi:ASKHA domain-containing protein [Kiritimatiella glycovorans]|uniref:Putative metal-binding protein n=1 Tax=Kiritimatiella glycovorans TaxID=1307763 RepID=A0A0G3ELJ8_9BACT|nr:ASKHA domain-containing protein [Kiritimatiella glycovorans]AKJ65660.1 putative metal-binding protein [Kiritimatiella glycovorans]